MYYEERTSPPGDPGRVFRFALSTEAEFLFGNSLLRIVEESTPDGIPYNKLVVRIPEDEAHPVMRAAGAALVVHDLIACGAWETFARRVMPGGPIPTVEVSALRPHLAKLEHPNL